MAWSMRHEGDKDTRAKTEFLREVATGQLKREGKVDERLRFLTDRPQLLPENGRALRAWQTIRQQRQHGFDAQPLAMHDIRAWMDMAGVDVASRSGLLSGILACESGWAQGQAARASKDQED